jgi:hypothetical protein
MKPEDFPEIKPFQIIEPAELILKSGVHAIGYFMGREGRHVVIMGEAREKEGNLFSYRSSNNIPLDEIVEYHPLVRKN